MILDNLGLLMAKVFRQPTVIDSISATGIKDINGVSISVRIYDSNNSNARFNRTSPNPRAQVGSGITPVTRQDFQIEIPFTNGGAEDNTQASNVVGYTPNSGLITAGTQIAPTGGSGNITEVIKTLVLNNTSQDAKTIAIFRNLVTPAVSFISAEAINVEHEVLI